MPAAICDDYSLALPYAVAAIIIDQSLEDILTPFAPLCGAKQQQEEVTSHAPQEK